MLVVDLISCNAESLQAGNCLCSLPGGLFNGIDLVGYVPVNTCFFEQLNITKDSGQVVVEIMGDTTCHFSQGTHFFRLHQDFLGTFFFSYFVEYGKTADLALNVCGRQGHFDRDSDSVAAQG